MTSDLGRRAFEHRTGAIPGFTERNKCKLLVWYEMPERMDEPIQRGKKIKDGSRAKKLEWIETMNSDGSDLFNTLNG